MQYILLIYQNEADSERWTEDEKRQSLARHTAFADHLRQEGRFLGRDGLQPSSTATCVRKDGGRSVFFDGPYAETREQLGGFYLIEAADLDQALAEAGLISDRPGEVIEVRPILDYSKIS